jgi:hypothetical protein
MEQLQCRRCHNPKIRIYPVDGEREPGRYRTTADLRGLDIGIGLYRKPVVSDAAKATT